MLTRRHRAAREGRQTSSENVTPEPVEPNEDGYTGLSDEEVFEAYTLTLPEGEATERDAQVVELRAVAAHTVDDEPQADDPEAEVEQDDEPKGDKPKRGRVK